MEAAARRRSKIELEDEVVASLDEAIKGVKRSLEYFSSKGDKPIEERTRDTLINRILDALGWDHQEPRLVVTQYDVLKSGVDRAVDYALLDAGERPIAFVEAKRLYNSLGAKEESQLNNYVWTYVGGLGLKRASKFGPAVLTDGRVWKFYPVDAGEGANHYAGWAHVIDLQEDDLGKCREDLERFLGHDRVLDGSANKALGITALRRQVGEVWQQILHNPGNDFIEFLQGKLGKDLPADLIRQVIAGKGGVAPSESMRGVPSRATSPVSSMPASLGAKEAERGHAPRASSSEGWGRTTISVVYKGQAIGGANQRGKPTLTEVLRRIVEDYGAESLVEACRRMRWRTKDPATVGERYRKKWLQVSGRASVNLDFNVSSMKRQLDGLSRAMGLGDQLQTIVIEIATGKQVESGAATEHAPWTKLQVRYKEHLVAESSRPKTIAEVLRLLFAKFGEDEFIKAYSGEVIRPAEAARRSAAKDWVDLSADVSVNVGWLATEVADRFDRLADALGIAGQIKSKFVPVDDSRGEIKVQVDGNEYLSTAAGMSGVSVLMNALSDIVAMPEVQGVDLARVCVKHSIIRQKKTWIISGAEFMDVEAKRKKDYQSIGNTNYMVNVTNSAPYKARNLRQLVDALGVGGRVKIWFRGELVG